MLTILSKYFPCILLCLAFILVSLPLSAQLSVELNHIKPIKRFGQAFKPGIGIEFNYDPQGDDRGKWGSTYSLGFFRVTPQQDTILGAYSIITERGERRFFGGYTIFNDFNYLTVGSQLNYRPLYDKAFTPVGFLSIKAYGNYRNSEEVTAQFNSSESAFDLGIGMGLGAGIEYATEGRFKFNFTVSRFFNWGSYQQIFEYWKTSLGATYFF